MMHNHSNDPIVVSDEEMDGLDRVLGKLAKAKESAEREGMLDLAEVLQKSLGRIGLLRQAITEGWPTATYETRAEALNI